MIPIKNSSIGSVIYELLKNKFNGFAVWDRVDSEIAVLSASIPEVTNDETIQTIVTILDKIRTFLVHKGIDPSDLRFLEEEKERYENTKQISLYSEQEDELPNEIIDKYARLGQGTEGIVGIHLAYNYTQLKKLTQGVYDRTGLVKFYISKEKTVMGKITCEQYEHAQKIPIATLVQSNKENKDGSPPVKKIILFGNKVDLKKYFVIKEIEIDFYVYRFLTEYNQELVLLSTVKLEIGDYTVTGVGMDCINTRMLDENVRLPTKLPILFAHTCLSRIIKFKNDGEFRKRLSILKVCKKNLYDLIFTVRVDNTQRLLKQPEWYKSLIWAWLLHASIGLFNKYPLHLLIIGPPSSGKSALINTLHDRTSENLKIFSGSSSTLKHLIPSFKYKPARMGYLAESNRFAFLDEFLRCLTRGRRDNDQGKEEAVALMNDLLEHQKREAGSGVSRINVNMTSRALATTNPLQGVRTVEDLVESFDGSFLSRWLIYHQSKEHVDLIRNSSDNELKVHEYVMDDRDLISIIDYLHICKTTYDLGRLKEIMSAVAPILSTNLRSHYASRQLHHLECIIDGVIKTRCLMNRECSFNAKSEDYEIASDVWRNVVRSWVGHVNIKGLPVKDRVFYLPADCQWLFKRVCKEGRGLDRFELEGLGEGFFSKIRTFELLAILGDNDVLVLKNGCYRPFYMEG